MRWLASLGAIVAIGAMSWSGWWFTPDQQGQRLMNQGEFPSAAENFRDPMRQGTAWFRAGEFEKAEQAFARVATAEAEYDRGTCLIMGGKYEAAVARFDRALELRPDWEDATVNRAIAIARAKNTEQKGGDLGDQEIGADKVVFDKDKESGGQDTDVTREQSMSGSDMQALWLRRIQTRPADFLRAKFAYQLGAGDAAGAEE